MESIHQQSVAPETSEKVTKPIRGFLSQEAMKTYYLQMANIMGTRHQGEHSDENSIRNLYGRLKQFSNALQSINSHDWGQGVAEIQNAAGIYMMQGDINRSKLMQNNEEISLHLQFITQLASNTSIFKQLQGIISCHFQNVEYLLKRTKA